MCRLVGAGRRAPTRRRGARVRWCEGRARARSRNRAARLQHAVSTSAMRDVRRRPRRRTAASAGRACAADRRRSLMPRANSCSPSLSFRKLVLRAIDAPLTALARCPISEPATRGSNTTGTLRVATLRGLSRATARSPALRPIFSGDRGRPHAAPRRNRSRAPCRCLRRRSPASRCRGASRDRRRKSPWLVTSTMPPMPAEADAPPDFADALHGTARLFGPARRRLQLGDIRQFLVDQIEIGKLRASSAGSASPA
jgi:hypothetical protein